MVLVPSASLHCPSSGSIDSGCFLSKRSKESFTAPRGIITASLGSSILLVCLYLKAAYSVNLEKKAMMRTGRHKGIFYPPSSHNFFLLTLKDKLLTLEFSHKVPPGASPLGNWPEQLTCQQVLFSGSPTPPGGCLGVQAQLF